MAKITAIMVVGNDAVDTRLCLSRLRPYVDEIIVTVQPSTDDTESAAREYADKVIVSDTNTFYLESYYAGMIEQAENDIILEFFADESLANGERLREIADLNYDIWWFDRIDYLDGHRVQFIPEDRHPRMHRRGALRWKQQMHTYPDQLSNKVAEVKEVWICHNRSIERIRQRQKQFADFATANGEADRVVPMQDAFLQRAEEVYSRIDKGNFPRKILFSYNGIVGIGDALMTTPAVREMRRQYPNAEITYLTQQGQVFKNNPYIDKIEDTPPEKWNPANESKYDIVVHWECSMTGDAGKRVNGYELESMFAGVAPESYKPDWFVTKAEDKIAQNFLKQNVHTPRVVGMALSASCLHRTWQHSEEFVECLLREYPDITLIFFGDARCRLLEMDKSSRFRPVKNNWGGVEYVQMAYDGPGADRIVRTSGNLPLREVAAIINKLDLLVAPDSGLMHIGAALGVPTVAYFNLVPSSLRVKHFPNVTALDADYECSPCFVHGTIACDKTTDEGAPCLHTITVDRMMGAVEEVLG